MKKLYCSPEDLFGFEGCKWNRCTA